MNWFDAMSWVKSLKYVGYSDWRLPTKEELELFSKHRPSEWFNANGFNTVPSNSYWSSSSYEIFPTTYAWYVYMLAGYADYSHKTGNHYVWPVRAGQ
jgi:hypothetical protein